MKVLLVLLSLVILTSCAGSRWAPGNKFIGHSFYKKPQSDSLLINPKIK